MSTSKVLRFIFGSLCLGMLMAPSAFGSETFHSEIANPPLLGEQVSPFNDKLTVTAGVVECGTAQYSGTLVGGGSTSTEAKLTPSYSECTSTFILELTIDANGCQWVFHADTNKVDLACPSEKSIVLTNNGCEVVIPPQSNLTGVTAYTSLGSGAARTVLIHTSISGIHYTEHNRFFARCKQNNVEQSNGEYSGGTTVWGESEGIKKGRWVGPVSPSANTEPASAIKTSEATLNGSINPNGLATTYHFEYGKSTSYGTSVPIPSETVGSGVEAVAESKTISGLSAGTTYHFRVVAEYSGITVPGGDREFTTSSTASALSALPVVSTFNGNAASLEDFKNNWTALLWAGGGTPKGEVTTSGWRPLSEYPTINGAFYGSTFSDTGSGCAAVVTMAANPASANRNFALWLDLNIEKEAKEGYALRFTYVSASTYTVTLERWKGGENTTLATKSSYSFVNGNSLAILDTGGSVSAWVNTGSGFTQLLSASDSSFSAGNPAIEGAGNVTRLTNFKAGQL